MTPEEVLTPLRILHRAPDGYIAFGRANTNAKRGWQNLFSYQIDELEEVLPDILPWLEQDAYFTVNAMFRAARYNNRLTGRPGVVRSKDDLRYLNACYVDLDVGRESSQASDGTKLNWREAWMTMTDMIAEGQLPQCSMVARSGRSAYAFWLLESDDDPALPPRSYPEKVGVYTALNKLLIQKLGHLFADTQTSDAARVLRVPGTWHSKGGEAAAYSIQRDVDGQPFSYTLDQLMTELRRVRPLVSLPGQGVFSRPQSEWIEIEETGRFAISSDRYAPSWYNTPEEVNVYETGINDRIINDTANLSEPVQNQSSESFPGALIPDLIIPRAIIPEVEVFGRPTKNPKTALRRYKGAVALNRLRARDLVKVHRGRGGWHKGWRRRGLSLCALCLRNADKDKVLVFNILEYLARECQPPYPSDPNDESLVDIVERTFSGRLKKLTTQKIIDAVRITDDEARQFDLKTLVSDSIRAERQLPPGGLREQKRIQRREFIHNFIQKNGMVSCRDLVAELKRSGISVSQQTVNEDLRLLVSQTAVSQSEKSKLKTRKSLARKTAGRPKNAASLNPPALLPQKLWERILPLLPPPKPHPLGCHRPRVDDRVAMTAILFVLSTGGKWSDLNATGICTSSTAHRRFKAWQKAGVFEQLHRQLLNDATMTTSAVLASADWSWLARAVGTPRTE